MDIHIIEGYISNITLIAEEKGLLLLDCGTVSDVRHVEKYCYRELGKSPQEIMLAVVSHNHPDHAGGAAVLRDKYGIPIAAHEEADAWYAGMGGFLQHTVDCCLAHTVARAKQRKFASARGQRIIHPDYTLKDLDFLPIFDDWQVLHVPGHTLHDIALYHNQESVLYVGDCILNIEGEIRLPVPVLFRDKMANSLHRLASLGASTILFGHGDALDISVRPDLFDEAERLLYRPLNRVERRVRRISFYSPAAGRELKKRRHEQDERVASR